MSITSYSGLLVALNRLIDGDNVSVTDVPTASLQAIIALGERRIYREVRSRHNEKAFSAVTTTSNLAPIPSDWEATSVIHFGGKALLPRPEDWIREYIENGASGDCKYFAEAGDSFYFGPAVADGTAVQGRYFCRLPDLSADTLPSNALFAAENDLFLYACLSESGPFFDQDRRVPIWESKYTRIRDEINAAKNRAAYSAGRIAVQPSTRLMG